MVAPLGRPNRPLVADIGAAAIWPTTHSAVRIYHAHPERAPLAKRTWGPIARFDPHVPNRDGKPQESADGRGIVYLADRLDCGLAEAFQDQPHEVQICAGMRAVQACPVTPAFLLDLTGNGAMMIGAVGTLAWGNEPRVLTQEWACSIHEDLPAFEGLQYRSAHQGGLAVAYWGPGALVSVPGSDVSLLDDTMIGRVQVALAAQSRTLRVIDSGECARCAAADAVHPPAITVRRSERFARSEASSRVGAP